MVIWLFGIWFMRPNLNPGWYRGLIYVFYFCAPGCRLSPSQSVCQSVCILRLARCPSAVVLQTRNLPRHFTFLLQGSDRIMPRWFPGGSWQGKIKQQSTVFVFVRGRQKKLPPCRNVCFQPGTGPERGAEPSRSRGGAAAGRRDIAAADRLRHPGLGRNAQSGPVSPLSLQPRQTPFKKPQILNPRGARRWFIYVLRWQPIRKRPVRRGSWPGALTVDPDVILDCGGERFSLVGRWSNWLKTDQIPEGVCSDDSSTGINKHLWFRQLMTHQFLKFHFFLFMNMWDIDTINPEISSWVPVLLEELPRFSVWLLNKPKLFNLSAL